MLFEIAFSPVRQTEYANEQEPFFNSTQQQTSARNIELLKEASWRGKTDIVKALLSFGTPLHCEVGVPGLGQESINRYASTSCTDACTDARNRSFNNFKSYSTILIHFDPIFRKRAKKLTFHPAQIKMGRGWMVQIENKGGLLQTAGVNMWNDTPRFNYLWPICTALLIYPLLL